jgi:hypothetical protein
VPLRRLIPTVKRTDLGHLRLTQDDLAETVRLVRQLPDAEILIESDNYVLDDVREDLPKIGPRVSSFIVRARRPKGSGMSDVLTAQLARKGCEIVATDPDLRTEGLIEALRTVSRTRRRMPSWLQAFYRPIWGPAGAAEPPLALLLTIPVLVAGVVAVISIERAGRGHSGPPIPWPASLFAAIAMLMLLAGLVLGRALSKTVIFTATAAETPTWWQQHRSDIAIAAGAGLIFYLLGLLTPRP